MIKLEQNLSIIVIKNGEIEIMENVINIILNEKKKLKRIQFTHCKLNKRQLNDLYNGQFIHIVYLEACHILDIGLEIVEKFIYKEKFLEECFVDVLCETEHFEYMLNISFQEDLSHYSIEIFTFLKNEKNEKFLVDGCYTIFKVVVNAETLNKLWPKLTSLCNNIAIISEFDFERIDFGFVYSDFWHRRLSKTVMDWLESVKFPFILICTKSFFAPSPYTDEDFDYDDFFLQEKEDDCFLQIADSKISFNESKIKGNKFMEMLNLSIGLQTTVKEIDMSQLRILKIFNDNEWIEVLDKFQNLQCKYTFPSFSVSVDQFFVLLNRFSDKLESINLKTFRLTDACGPPIPFENSSTPSDAMLRKLTTCFLYLFDNEIEVESKQNLITNKQFDWIINYLLENLDKTLKNLTWLQLEEIVNDDNDVQEIPANNICKLIKEYKFLQLPQFKLKFNDLERILNGIVKLYD